MATNTVAVVLGVLPKDNQLPPQVLACLDRAIHLLEQEEVNSIAVVGGYGHGSEGQKRPEAEMMRDYLLSKCVDNSLIITNDKPVTTPEAIWEIRKSAIAYARLLTITQKQPRIAYLIQMIIASSMSVTTEIVPYVLTPAETQANQYETYLLLEAQRELAGMTPGDEKEFKKRYSFEHHLWQNYVNKLKAEGKL